MAAFGEKLSGLLLRRVRLATVLTIIGACGLILAQDASWTGIMLGVATLLAVVIGWLGALSCIRLMRSSGGRHGL